jgi:hypothetical protein
MFGRRQHPAPSYRTLKSLGYTLLNNKCSWIVIFTLPTLMPLLNAISRTAIRLFPKISSSTRQTFTSRRAVGWTWACDRFATYLVPSKNLLYQPQTSAHDWVSFPYYSFNIRRISASVTVFFTRNLMIRRCSTLGVTRHHLVLPVMCRSKVYSRVPGSDCSVATVGCRSTWDTD